MITYKCSKCDNNLMIANTEVINKNITKVDVECCKCGNEETYYNTYKLPNDICFFEFTEADLRANAFRAGIEMTDDDIMEMGKMIAPTLQSMTLSVLKSCFAQILLERSRCCNA